METAATPDTRHEETSALYNFFRVLRRRKWFVLQALLIAPLTAVLLSLHQEAAYEATSEVLLGQEDFATGVNNVYLQWQDPARIVETQAGLARTPVVAERVLDSVGLRDRTAREFLDASHVSTKQNSNVLDFSVVDANPALARRLATEYAEQYKAYRLELDTVAPAEAREELEARITALNEAGKDDTDAYGSLLDKVEQLRVIEKLQAAKVSVIRRAESAEQVQPRPFRNGVLGFAIGAVIAVALAFLVESVDTRIRSANEIARRLGLPLLARLPAPRRRLRNERALVSVEEPDGPHAEAFRMLRTNIDLASLDRRPKVVMVTSAVGGEGKSTTAANLAVTAARAGRRVVLVDLDLRQPALHRFFSVDPQPGLTDVALGDAELEEALQPVVLTDNERPRSNGGHASSNGRANGGRTFEVVTTGPLPPDPGEFVATAALTQILAELRDRADLVIVDSPPLLQVGDALAASPNVDALLLVTRLNVVNRRILDELRRILDTAPSAKLGFVLTDAKADEEFGYGQYAYYQPAARSREGRVGKTSAPSLSAD